VGRVFYFGDYGGLLVGEEGYLILSEVSFFGI